MGLIQAGLASLSTVLADQWREYFYCDALPVDVLVRKGVKRVSGKSSNTKGSDNIISNGSLIAVNEGQCMMIVEQGAIVEFCAEAGEFVWDSSTEPSIFFGGLGQGIKDSWELLKKRFTFGGDTAKDQRIYYFNLKEIMGNKYGTANPVPFQVLDKNIGLNMTIGLKCFGEYSYKLTDPMLFYKNVCGNVTDDYYVSEMESQLKTELLTALQPAFAKISASGVAYSEVPAHTDDLATALNETLSEKWGKFRGIQIVSFGISSLSANEEDEKKIKELQASAVLKDPTMAAAHLASAQAAAMQTAAANESGMGAAMGFMGMNMASNAGGMNTAQLFQMGQQQQAAAAAAPAGNAWICPTCGASCTSNFCPTCGEKKPQPQGWVCPKCGASCTGNFCPTCGEKKPE